MKFDSPQACEEHLYWCRVPWLLRIAFGWRVLAIWVVGAVFAASLLYLVVCSVLAALRVLLGADPTVGLGSGEDSLTAIDNLGRMALGLNAGGGIALFLLFVVVVYVALVREWSRMTSPWATHGKQAGELANRARRYQLYLHELRRECIESITRLGSSSVEDRTLQLAKWVDVAEPMYRVEETVIGAAGTSSLFSRVRGSFYGGGWAGLIRARNGRACVWVLMPPARVVDEAFARTAVAHALGSHHCPASKAMGPHLVHVICLDDSQYAALKGITGPDLEVFGPGELCLLIAGADVWLQRNAVMTRYDLPWVEARSVLRTGRSSTEGFEFANARTLRPV
jgi:hypothetical protein